MALARVVSFEGVDAERMAQISSEIDQDERPDDVPATEIMLLHDPAADRALAILFFDTEEDYRRGHETLDAMPADETPGRRAAVTKYTVSLRKSA